MITRQKGMTLVEVLAVIVLIGLIMTVVAKGVMGKADKAKAQTNKLQLEKIANSLGQYRLENNKYPGSLEELVSTGDLDKRDLNDVFGNPITYRAEGNGRSFSIMTYGSDGVAGGEGPKADVTITP